MTEFLQRDFAHQSFFDLCIHEKQRLRQALNPLSNLLLTKIQLCWDLPNITGTWWARGPEKGVSEASGAFVLTEPSNYGRGHDSGGATAGIDFSADRATGIYGGSSTVQPASIHALACIKV